MSWLGLEHLQAVDDDEPIRDENGTSIVPCRSKGGPILPAKVCCTAPMPLKNGTKTIRYRDQAIRHRPTWLEVQRQRFKCKSCGATIYEELPDLDDKHRITKRLRESIALSAVKRTHQDAANVNAVEEKLVRRVFDEYASEKLKDYQPRLPRVLGVDENHILGGNRFVCADIETGKILDLLPSRDLPALRRYFEFASFRTDVEVFVQDMWHGYRTIQQEFFPCAINVIDKFHVVRQANLGFESARKAYQASLTKEGRISMKRRHRMFLSRWSGLEEERRDKVMEVLSEHPALQQAYLLKEGFYQIYEADTRHEAERLYDRWKDAVPQQFRTHFHPLVVSMRNWREPIFNYYDARYTNGMVENLNGRINKINSLAYGMKFETLRAKALLRYGEIVDVDDTYFFHLEASGGIEGIKRFLPWWNGEWPVSRTYPTSRGFSPSTLSDDLMAGAF